MAYFIRTDLALEARELNSGGVSELEGVVYEKTERDGCAIHNMEITGSDAAQKLGKPIGKYCTIELEGLINRQSENFEAVSALLSEQLDKLMGTRSDIETTLVVGLGNRDITPDAIGEFASDNVLVTKHLKEQLPEDFAAFSPVCVVRPGVMGTSGVESGEYVKALCDTIKPGRVIVVDALAAREMDRLCRTVQISDTGIVPGSGVGNSRGAISKETLGVPVIAIGVPTVVDIGTVLKDCGAADGYVSNDGLFVTPRSIDADVRAAGKLIGYSIDLALHRDITISDIDLLIG